MQELYPKKQGEQVKIRKKRKIVHIDIFFIFILHSAMFFVVILHYVMF